MLLSRNRSSLVDRGHGRSFARLLAGAAPALALALLVPARAGGARDDARAGIDTPKVVLVRMTSCCGEVACADAESLLVDELSSTALEFTAVDGEPGEAGGGDRLLAGRLGESRGVALRVFRAPGGGACEMELWARGRGADETARRRIVLPALGEPDWAVNAAIESAEAVYAVLLEMKLVAADALRGGRSAGAEPSAAPGKEEATAGPATDAGSREPAGAVATARVEPGPAPTPKERDRLLGLGVGAALIWSPGGVDPMGAVRLSFDGRPVGWLTLRADAWVTVVGRDIERDSGQATFDAAAFRLSGFYEFVRSGWVRPALGIAAGGFVVWTSGAGSGGYSGGREAALAGYLGGAGRIGFVFTKWLRGEVGAAVGAVMPEVRVVFAGESVAEFGRPVLDAHAQLEVSFL